MTTALNDLPPFPGIRSEGLDFLVALGDEKHQDRNWFNERKHLYTDELRWPMRCLVADVVRKLEGHSSVKLYGDPQKSVFRIYRDVRFSKNKRPYQTHVACKLTVNTSLQDEQGLVYVHVEPPDEFFVAAGIYAPPVKRLRPIRNRIVDEPFVWRDVVDQLERAGLMPQSHGDDLSGMPRGFAEHAGHEMAKYLKWTSFLAVEHFERNTVQSRELSDAVVSFSEKAWPLLRFIGETR